MFIFFLILCGLINNLLLLLLVNLMLFKNFFVGFKILIVFLDCLDIVKLFLFSRYIVRLLDFRILMFLIVLGDRLVKVLNVLFCKLYWKMRDLISFVVYNLLVGFIEKFLVFFVILLFICLCFWIFCILLVSFFLVMFI